MTPSIPRVSILLAVRNGATRLPVALTSTLAQRYDPWELIAVDDASTDQTPHVLTYFSQHDPRIKIINLSSQLGLGAALNLAARRASGEFFARLDHDDFSLQDRLEKQVHFLDTHPQVAVLGSGAYVRNQSNQTIGTILLPEHHDRLSTDIWRTTPFLHPSVIMRRTFFEALGGYNPRFRRSQDRDLWLRGVHRFRYHNLQEPLISYSIPQRPPFTKAIWSAAALIVNAYRQRNLLALAKYAPRTLIAGTLSSLGLKRQSILKSLERYPTP